MRIAGSFGVQQDSTWHILGNDLGNTEVCWLYFFEGPVSDVWCLLETASVSLLGCSSVSIDLYASILYMEYGASIASNLSKLKCWPANVMLSTVPKCCMYGKSLEEREKKRLVGVRPEKGDQGEPCGRSSGGLRIDKTPLNVTPRLRSHGLTAHATARP